MIEDVECPYCEAWNEINHDDGQGYEENVKHQQNCKNCGKTFVFETEIVFSYTAYEAPCLNGGEHNWRSKKSFTEELSWMECEFCDEIRELTEDQKQKYFPK